MNRMKKLAGLALVVSLTAGAGVAWANQADNPTGEVGAPAPASPRTSNPDGTSELKFVPITPCRLVDTRSVGGPLAPNASRSYDVIGGGSSFIHQGGKPGGCGIPDSAQAIELTATAVSASGNGYLRIYPEAMPNATFMNTTPSFNVSNTGTVGLCGVSGLVMCTANRDLTVKNFTASTNLVIDVQGYYILPITAEVSASGSLLEGSRVISAAPNGTSGVGTYDVTFDRDISQCSITGSSEFYGKDINVTHANSGNDTVFVKIINNAGVASTADFFLEVTC